MIISSIPLQVLEAAVKGGLEVAGPAVKDAQNNYDYVVNIPSLELWVRVNHDPAGCFPDSSDGLCYACEDMVEGLEYLTRIPDTENKEHASEESASWHPHPPGCCCAKCLEDNHYRHYYDGTDTLLETSQTSLCGAETLAGTPCQLKVKDTTGACAAGHRPKP